MSYVYVMEAGGFLKFGISYNPRKRVAEIQTGCPHEVVLIGATWEDDYASDFEAMIHKDLKDAGEHVRGEWFKGDRSTGWAVHVASVDASLAWEHLRSQGFDMQAASQGLRGMFSPCKISGQACNGVGDETEDSN